MSTLGQDAESERRFCAGTVTIVCTPDGADVEVSADGGILPLRALTGIRRHADAIGRLLRGDPGRRAPGRAGVDASVQEFWDGLEERFAWDLLPFGFLYDLYKAWSAGRSPSERVLGKSAFIDDLVRAVSRSCIWYCRGKGTTIRTASRMSRPEPLIAEFDLTAWMPPGCTGEDIAKRCTPVTAQIYRGLERYSAHAVAQHSGGRSANEEGEG